MPPDNPTPDGNAAPSQKMLWGYQAQGMGPADLSHHAPHSENKGHRRTRGMVSELLVTGPGARPPSPLHWRC